MVGCWYMPPYIWEQEHGGNQDRARAVIGYPFLIIVLIGFLSVWIDKLSFLKFWAADAIILLAVVWFFIIMFGGAFINFIEWLNGK